MSASPPSPPGTEPGRPPSAPSDATAAPSDATAGPSDATAGPSDATAGPSDGVATPSNQPAAATERLTAPSAPPLAPSAPPSAPSAATPGPAVRPPFGSARVERIGRVDHDLRERLLEIWTDVSNAGGWVGFVPPVDRHEIAPVLDAALRRVHDEVDWLVVVRVGPAADGASAPEAPADVAGFAIVAANDRLLSEHWRWVLRVQVHPDHQGARLGAVLLDGIADMALDAGLEMLHLTVRGGEGLETFYARAGYREVARIPRAIRVAPGDDRDQVVLVRDLRGSAPEG